jgi:Dolichyl-phosphate-mannose-protein mannosyltransferase
LRVVEGDLSGGRSRRGLAGLIVGGLVVVSILGRILLGREIPTPWIAPDEMIYGLIGRTLYASGRLAIENAHSDFYSLVYPALIGGPLAWLSPHRGYEVAKALGAVSMSLAAVPAYLWARSVVSKRAAVLVAALTLALPAFAYTGLLMTETVFYPLLVLVCWVAARTLVAPTPRDQLLLVGLVAAAVLTRLQAGVLVLVFPTAALFAGVGLRAAPRRFAIVFAGFGLIVLAWLVWRLTAGGGALGAYTVAASGGYHPFGIVRFIVYHVGDLVLLTGFFPTCAAALLWFERRRLSSEARAALAVATALSLWLVLEVGAFASHYVGHVAERDLIAAAPPLFLCLAVWLELGAPRTLRRTLLVTVIALLALLAWPLNTLLTPAALPDAAGLIPIYRLAGATLGRQHLILDGGAALAALVLILAPRRVLGAVPYVLVALLGIGSVSAEHYAAKQSRLQQQTMLGPGKNWIDRAAPAPVGLLYGDRFQWPAVWESLFWNRKLAEVFPLPGAKLIGPAPGNYVGLSNDGTVLVGGRPLPYRYVVAELGLLVNGTPIADAGTSPGGVVAPWRLWQLDGPLQLVGRTSGVQANGDIYRSATVHASSCPGTLRLTLLAKQDEQIGLYRQGSLYRRLNVTRGNQPLKVLHLSIPSAPGAHGPCNFRFTSTGLLGSTVIAFQPR